MNGSQLKKHPFCKFPVIRVLLFASLIFILASSFGFDEHVNAEMSEHIKAPIGVCPPFFLRDEAGNIIDPVNGVNAAAPYSPKQTCGTTGCHDYKKITEGYHFTQGAGEEPTEAQKTRIEWATTPGNFGGSWCSPAPNGLPVYQLLWAVSIFGESYTGWGDCS